MCVGMMLGGRLCNLWDGCVGGYGVFVCGMRGVWCVWHCDIVTLDDFATQAQGPWMRWSFLLI